MKPKCFTHFCDKHMCMMIMRDMYCNFAKECSGKEDVLPWREDGYYDYEEESMIVGGKQ